MKEAKYHLLVVDDEPVTRNNFRDYFEAAGFFVTDSEDGKNIYRFVAENDVDLVLLDINLPGEDGLSIARELRRTSNIGIILVTGRNEDIDRVVGLEIGADDYVTKPVNPRELLARVKSTLWRMDQKQPAKREEPHKTNGNIKEFSKWHLDLDKQQLRDLEGNPLSLTDAEYKILSYFAHHPGVVLSRDKLTNQINGSRGENFSSRTVDVLVGRLRKKLETEESEQMLIETIRGKGYRFTNHVTDT